MEASCRKVSENGRKKDKVFFKKGLTNKKLCGILAERFGADAGVAEQADASDLKSGGRNTVWVQVPLSPPSRLN